MANAPSEFTPPHCPNRNCRFHNPISPGWRYKKAGFFSRRQRPHRIQRYQCHACHRYFSTQTFHITYWLKRADVVTTLLTKTVGCMANRQIARDIGAAPKTVDDQLSRLGATLHAVSLSACRRHAVAHFGGCRRVRDV
jgi:transposase-like protein